MRSDLFADVPGSIGTKETRRSEEFEDICIRFNHSFDLICHNLVLAPVYRNFTDAVSCFPDGIFIIRVALLSKSAFWNFRDAGKLRNKLFFHYLSWACKQFFSCFPSGFWYMASVAACFCRRVC